MKSKRLALLSVPASVGLVALVALLSLDRSMIPTVLAADLGTTIVTGGLPRGMTPPAGRLGNPAYNCVYTTTNPPWNCTYSVPYPGQGMSYAQLKQSLTVPPVPPGKLLYLKFTYDIFTQDQNPELNDRYDRFEVWVNNHLMFYDMNSTKPVTSGLYELGVWYGRIPLADISGQSVSVAFRLQNEPDGLFNTYVYLDDIRLEYEP